MMKFAVVLAVAAVAFAAVDLSTPVHAPEVFSVVNADPTSTWTAGVNEKFIGATLGDVATLCGVNTPLEQRMKLPALEEAPLAPEAIPAAFDLRTNATHCPLVGKARDQSACGSCWAFGSTEAFNDRKCIATNGAFQTELSAQDTASCCSGFSCGMSMGCNGGQPGAAWNWFTSRGVVSGAGYDTIGSGSSCWPYQLEICAHHVPASSGIPACPEQEYSTPTCRDSCSESSYTTAFSSDKHFAKSAYSVPSVEQMQTELMTKGSLTAAFTVYADFPTYKSGVYQHKTGGELGGHAIKIVGWGEENGTPYWTVMNSWNQKWGDDGAFKILRGSDECGIESDVSAGDV